MLDLGRAVRLCSIAVAALALSACATYRNVSELEAGPRAEFVPAEIEKHREAQTKVLKELYALAGLKDEPVAGGNWDPVVFAGMDYADMKCENYMHALFRLNRDKKTVTSQIGLIGTATAGIFAATHAAAKAVEITAIAFGFGSATVDNLSSNLLYELEPSSVRTMVKRMQADYRERGVGTGYVSRPGAVSAIRSYALLCVPASIEAEVNLSVKKAKPDLTPADPANNKPAVVTNAITVASDQSFQSDENSDVLRKLVFPNGATVDDAGRRRLEGYMTARGIANISVVSFMNGANFAQERSRAARFFANGR